MLNAMDPDLKLLLEKNLELSRKTLEVVQKLHRAAVWQHVWFATKWIFFAILLVISYWQLQPYLGTLYNVYGSSASKIIPEIQGLIPGAIK